MFMSLKPTGWVGQAAAGHPHCYEPSNVSSGSPDVYIEGYRAVRVGDPVDPHSGSCSKHSKPHSRKVYEGLANVFANGKRLACEGHLVKCATGQTAPLLRGRATVLGGVPKAGTLSTVEGDAQWIDVQVPQPDLEETAARLGISTTLGSSEVASTKLEKVLTRPPTQQVKADGWTIARFDGPEGRAYGWYDRSGKLQMVLDGTGTYSGMMGTGVGTLEGRPGYVVAIADQYKDGSAFPFTGAVIGRGATNPAGGKVGYINLASGSRVYGPDGDVINQRQLSVINPMAPNDSIAIPLRRDFTMNDGKYELTSVSAKGIPLRIQDNPYQVVGANSRARGLGQNEGIVIGTPGVWDDKGRLLRGTGTAGYYARDGKYVGAAEQRKVEFLLPGRRKEHAPALLFVDTKPGFSLLLAESNTPYKVYTGDVVYERRSGSIPLTMVQRGIDGSTLALNNITGKAVVGRVPYLRGRGYRAAVTGNLGKINDIVEQEGYSARDKALMVDGAEQAQATGRNIGGVIVGSFTGPVGGAIVTGYWAGLDKASLQMATEGKVDPGALAGTFAIEAGFSLLADGSLLLGGKTIRRVAAGTSGAAQLNLPGHAEPVYVDGAELKAAVGDQPIMRSLDEFLEQGEPPPTRVILGGAIPQNPKAVAFLDEAARVFGPNNVMVNDILRPDPEVAAQIPAGMGTMFGQSLESIGLVQNTKVVLMAPDYHFLDVLPDITPEFLGDGSELIIWSEIDLAGIANQFRAKGFDVEYSGARMPRGTRRPVGNQELPVDSAYLGGYFVELRVRPRPRP